MTLVNSYFSLQRIRFAQSELQLFQVLAVVMSYPDIKLKSSLEGAEKQIAQLFTRLPLASESNTPLLSSYFVEIIL